jgi:hypothetical protein
VRVDQAGMTSRLLFVLDGQFLSSDQLQDGSAIPSYALLGDQRLVRVCGGSLEAIS